jgi:hypothetical protein
MSIFENLIETHYFFSKNIPFLKNLRDNRIAMRSKHIAALITFFATFAFSAFIALLFATPKMPYVPPVNTYEFKSYSSKSCTGSKIENFLVRDKRNGDEMDGYKLSYEEGFVLPSSLNVFANSVSEYVAESGSMDESRLPVDFQIAWREHMRAWSEYDEFLQNARNERMSFEERNIRDVARNSPHRERARRGLARRFLIAFDIKNKRNAVRIGTAFLYFSDFQTTGGRR